MDFEIAPGTETAVKVTVIIPAYNAANHLPACLTSVLSQTLDSLEIVCVDDASTDATAEVLSEFAAAHPTIRIVTHKANKGEGASRNTGLKCARGEYLFHLDSDDTIPVRALERLYCVARENRSDMVRGAFEKVFPGGRTELQSWPLPPGEVSNTTIGESAILQQLPPSHCAYLYRRQFVVERQLCYPEDLLVGLDLVALAHALINASSVAIIPDIVYHYRQSGGSVTRGSLSLRLPLDAIEARRRAVALLRENGFSSAAHDRMRSWGFDINRYWLRIPESLGSVGAKQVFEAVRSLLADHGVVPWRANSGHHHRYLLALIMAGQDERAFDFLSAKALTEGFSDIHTLKESLCFVLGVVPDDAGALYRLGVIARQEGNRERALDLLRQVLHIDPGHERAASQARQLAREIERGKMAL